MPINKPSIVISNITKTLQITKVKYIKEPYQKKDLTDLDSEVIVMLLMTIDGLIEVECQLINQTIY
jgi:hypothetical protein